eukprot:c4594_g1_i1.p1 GENE.c4594_g1_i1~~c4594_g1_i1.p1  ORF type:complete len:350 (-),score=62.57 c4594_g1_i1:31-1047(-)
MLTKVGPPLYCAANGGKYMIVGGGGGSSKTGVQNVVLRVKCDERKIDVLQNREVVDAVHALKLLPSHKDVVCAVGDELQVFPIKDQKIGQLHKSTKIPDRISSLEINSTGDLIAVGLENGQLHLFDASYSSIGKVVVEDVKASVKSISFHPTQPVVAFSHGRSFLTIANTNSASKDAVKRLTYKTAFRSCHFLANSHLLTVHSEPKQPTEVVIWTPSNASAAKPYELKSLTRVTKDVVVSSAVSHDGRLLALGTNEGAVIVLVLKDLSILCQEKLHPWMITGLAFAETHLDHTKQQLVSVSAAGTVGFTLCRPPSITLTQLLIFIALVLLTYLYLFVW